MVDGVNLCALHLKPSYSPRISSSVARRNIAHLSGHIVSGVNLGHAHPRVRLPSPRILMCRPDNRRRGECRRSNPVPRSLRVRLAALGSRLISPDICRTHCDLSPQISWRGKRIPRSIRVRQMPLGSQRCPACVRINYMWHNIATHNICRQLSSVYHSRTHALHICYPLLFPFALLFANFSFLQ